MKRKIYFLMLITSITGTAIAQDAMQTTKTEKIFDIKPDNFKRKFMVEMGKGNTMQVAFGKMEDLNYFKNVDSLIKIFFRDISLLKDTLDEEAIAKRIDFIAVANGNNKIRVQLYKPMGASFMVSQGEAASLKLEQDTVNFIVAIPYIVQNRFRKSVEAIRYCQLSFFVNQLSDLKNIVEGKLQEKITNIQKDVKEADWTKRKDGTTYVQDFDPTIYAKKPAGYTVDRTDYLAFRESANLQNYKNYFVPSFSLGASVFFSNGYTKRDIGIVWEPSFIFGKNTSGSLTTFRNDFLTLSYGQGRVVAGGSKSETTLQTSFSLGYLIKRAGDYYDKNTFRLGAGQLSLFDGKTKIEPVLYFNNFFKGVTPGIRLVQSF
jgi:hypothetical protein